MATIMTKTSRLSVSEKCERGRTIITMSTDNPDVPGNAPFVAAFAEAQDGLAAAELALALLRSSLEEGLIRRDGMEKLWDQRIGQLAGFTQAATGGNRVAITGTGFGVRERNAKPQPLPAPSFLTATTNGSPGKTKLTWEPLDGAASYLVEMCPDVFGEAAWTQVDTPTKSSCELNGAEPGKPCWFRVAGVNPTGQSPWSAPACRQVM